MHGAYLGAILVALIGLGAIDFRFKLAVFANPIRAFATVFLGVAAFLVWDLIGIAAHVFFPTADAYSLGFQLLPGMQVEEPFFLTLLCYNVLVIYAAAVRRASKGRS